jgi:hypothetical protein
MDPAWVRAARQGLIEEITTYVGKVIGGEERPALANDEGVGFIGSSMFGHLDVSGHDVLRGLYLGGLRDSPEVRFEMEAKYGVVIGGGECFLVNTKVMREMGLNADILAQGAHEDMMDYYREKGLIVADSGRDGGDLEYIYIRFRRGPGASDDTAIIAAGLLYGLGTAVGVFLADAIDTLEKYVPVYSDQDQNIANKIKEKYAKLDISDAELRHLAYLEATPLESDFAVPDSSLRYLLQIEPRHDLTAVESHLYFIQGKKYAPIHVGHNGVMNRELYAYVQDRITRSPGPM